MFILDITYTAPIEVIDGLLADHIAWLEQGRADGMFMAWGRKVPRDGGLVYATGARETVEAAAQRDPFVANGAASVRVIEFVPSYADAGLEGLSR